MKVDSQEIARIDIGVIRDVIDAVDARLTKIETAGAVSIAVPRSQVYAAVLHEVFASARETGYGQVRLVNAPILDDILDGVEENGLVDLFEAILTATITN